MTYASETQSDRVGRRAALRRRFREELSALTSARTRPISVLRRESRHPSGTSGQVPAVVCLPTEIVEGGLPRAISNPAQLATQVATEPIYSGVSSTRRFASVGECVRAQLTACSARSRPRRRHSCSPHAQVGYR